jgi:Scramblase
MLIFDVNTSNTNGSDAPQLGKIVKTPKNAIAEAFTDADVFVLHFPTSATVEQKATIIGAAMVF